MPTGSNFSLTGAVADSRRILATASTKPHMSGNAVCFSHDCVIVFVEPGAYFALRLDDLRTISLNDEVCGAFGTAGIDHWLNVTRRLLLRGPVIGRGASPEHALAAIAADVAAPRVRQRAPQNVSAMA